MKSRRKKDTNRLSDDMATAIDRGNALLERSPPVAIIDDATMTLEQRRMFVGDLVEAHLKYQKSVDPDRLGLLAVYQLGLRRGIERGAKR